MKKLQFVLPVLCSLFIFLISCKDEETYAEQLANEKKEIADYISWKGIKVVKTLPQGDSWPEDEYYLTDNGLYINVEKIGDNPDSVLAVNKEICIRFTEKDLSVNNDTITYTNIGNNAEPVTIYYNNVQNTSYGDCSAWHEALSYVGDNSIVHMIVPSKLGWSTYYNNTLTPRYYYIRYTYAK